MAYEEAVIIYRNNSGCRNENLLIISAVDNCFSLEDKYAQLNLFSKPEPPHFVSGLALEDYAELVSVWT